MNLPDTFQKEKKNIKNKLKQDSDQDFLPVSIVASIKSSVL